MASHVFHTVIDEPQIPNFDSTVLTTGNKPFALTVETHGGDIHGVSIKCDQLRCGFSIVRSADVERSDRRTGVEEELAISYMLTFLWIAAAKRRLLKAIGAMGSTGLRRM